MFKMVSGLHSNSPWIFEKMENNQPLGSWGKATNHPIMAQVKKNLCLNDIDSI